MLIEVPRRFDDDLVGADAAHHVVDALAALVQFAFDLQGGKLVGHHADAPPFAVALRAGVAIGDDFAGRLVLVAFAERAEAALLPLRRGVEVVRAPGAAGGDDHPTADDRVFAEVWHGGVGSGQWAVSRVSQWHQCFSRSHAPAWERTRRTLRVLGVAESVCDVSMALKAPRLWLLAVVGALPSVFLRRRYRPFPPYVCACGRCRRSPRNLRRS